MSAWYRVNLAYSDASNRSSSGSCCLMSIQDAKNKFLGKSFEIRPTGVAHVDLKIPAAWVANPSNYPPDPNSIKENPTVLEHYSFKKVTTSVCVRSSL